MDKHNLTNECASCTHLVVSPEERLIGVGKVFVTCIRQDKGLRVREHGEVEFPGRLAHHRGCQGSVHQETTNSHKHREDGLWCSGRVD